MKNVARICMATTGLTLNLLVAGCGSGGGLAGLFGGGGDLASQFFSFFGGGDGGGSDALAGLGGLGDGLIDSSPDGDGGLPGGSGVAQQVAKLHNPEPATMALFGSGLAGIMLKGRRRSKRKPS